MTESPSNENQPKERYYVGRNRPVLQVISDPPDWPGKLYPPEELEMTDGDSHYNRYDLDWSQHEPKDKQ